MHEEAMAFLVANVDRSAKSVLDVGGRDINGSPRALFPSAEYVSLDVVDGPGVDVVADIVDWSSRRKFDLVVCAEVLEHVEDWKAVVKACWRHVAPGGRLLVTCATTGRVPHSAVDGGRLRRGEWYAAVLPGDLEEALPGCTVEVHPARGDLYATVRRPKEKAGG